jgi:hypothetical protein
MKFRRLGLKLIYSSLLLLFSSSYIYAFSLTSLVGGNPLEGKIYLEVYEHGTRSGRQGPSIGWRLGLGEEGEFSNKLQVYEVLNYKEGINRTVLCFNTDTSLTIGNLYVGGNCLVLGTYISDITESSFSSSFQASYNCNTKNSSFTVQCNGHEEETFFYSIKGPFLTIKLGMVGQPYLFVEVPNPPFWTDPKSEFNLLNKNRVNELIALRNIPNKQVIGNNSGEAEWNARWKNVEDIIVQQGIWLRNYIQSLDSYISTTYPNPIKEPSPTPTPTPTPAPTPTPFPELKVSENKTCQFIANIYHNTRDNHFGFISTNYPCRIAITNYFSSNSFIMFEGFAFNTNSGAILPVNGYFESNARKNHLFNNVKDLDGEINVSITNSWVKIKLANQIHDLSNGQKHEYLSGVSKLTIGDRSDVIGINGTTLLTNGSLSLSQLIETPKDSFTKPSDSNNITAITNNNLGENVFKSSNNAVENSPTNNSISESDYVKITNNSIFSNYEYKGNIVNSESGNKSSISLTISSTSQSYSPNHIPIHGKLVMSNGKTDDGFNGYFDSTSTPKSFSLGWDNSQGTMEMNGKVIDSSLIATWRIKTKPEGKIVSGTIDASK